MRTASPPFASTDAADTTAAAAEAEVLAKAMFQVAKAWKGLVVGVEFRLSRKLDCQRSDRSKAVRPLSMQPLISSERVEACWGRTASSMSCRISRHFGKGFEKKSGAKKLNRTR
jgi:hypothetical protein